MGPRRWKHTIPLRLRSLFRRAQADQELDEELQDHLERKAEEYAAQGFDPAEARRRAMLDMDGIERNKEECREMRRVNWLHDLIQDLQYGLRVLLARPGFTAAAVLNLALGIGATIAVFSAIESLLLRPLPFHNPDQLVLVWGTNLKDGQARDVLSGPNFIDLQRQGTTLSGLAAFHFSDMPARAEGGGVGAIGQMEVTPEFFAVLGVRPVLGRTFDAEDGLPERNRVALLSHSFWRQRFGGDPHIVGKTLVPLGQPHTIVGVLPPGFLFFTAPDVVTPLVPSELEKDGRTQYHYWAVGRVKEGVDREQAESELDGLMAKIGREFSALRNWEATVEPLQATLAEPVKPALWVLLCAAGILLVIGCANVASLLLARGVDRRREFSIRTALGASRARLVRQLLAENLLLALVSGAGGTALASVLIGGLAGILPQTVAITGSAALVSLPPVEMDARVVVFAALVSAVTVLLFGLVPAQSVSRKQAQPIEELRTAMGSTSSGMRSRRMQSALLLAETMLATVLLIGAGLMLRTVRELVRTDPGFRAEKVVGMYVGPGNEVDEPARARFYQAVIESVRTVPGVEAAALNDYLLLQNEDDYQGLVPEGKPLVQESVTREEKRRVTTDYFHTLGIALLSGRDFTDADTDAAPSVAIVNLAFARKYWPGENAVGKRFYLTNKKYGWTEIVGLVGDERGVSVALPGKPTLYLPFYRAPRPRMGLVVRTTGHPLERLGEIQRAVWSVDASRPIYGVVLLEALVRESISIQRVTLTLASAMAAIAMVLTAIGIFGIVSYAVSRRGREFGIRSAFGAQPRDLLALVLRDGLRVVFVGVAMGAGIAALVGRALASLLYNVTPTDPATFAVVGGLLLSVAVVACYLPARRAARIDPMIALRHE